MIFLFFILLLHNFLTDIDNSRVPKNGSNWNKCFECEFVASLPLRRELNLRTAFFVNCMTCLTQIVSLLQVSYKHYLHYMYQFANCVYFAETAKTKVVRGLNIRNLTASCVFGNATLIVGDEVTVDDNCTKCTCSVPPFVTCMRKDTCDSTVQ